VFKGKDTAIPVVETIKDRCRRCYSCIRNCPAKAIRIERGQAMVIQERCIGCGRCVRVCAQKAKKIESGVERTEQFLQSGEPVYAILAPSFPAAYPEAKAEQLVAAVAAAGFSRVFSVAVGADLVARAFRELYQKQSYATLITTSCPAVVSYIEKHQPSLLLFTAPIVSPMIATGRLLRSMYSFTGPIVFIGPCIAKKKEKSDPKVSGVIDEVLTFHELNQLLDMKRIAIAEQGERELDQPWPQLGSIFPVSGGLLRSTELAHDLLSNEVIVAEGPERVLEVLRHVEQGTVEARILDLLFCQGCIDGPAMNSGLSVYLRKDIVANYCRRWLDKKKTAPALEAVDMTRRFTREAHYLPLPSEEDIAKIFLQIDKHNPSDELNCGACGYSSCREKAIAVYQGRAEVEMCLPFLIERLEKMNREVLDAQERLIHAARLTSMGEVAAGVAHEINNPVAGVLTYVKLMKKKVQEQLPEPTLSGILRYLEIMETEMRRVSEIVKELLDFARPTDPDVTRISVTELMKKSLFLLSHQFELQNIHITETYPEPDEFIQADLKQMQQVLLNILINAAQAMPKGGALFVRSRQRGVDQVEIEIQDTGEGIPQEHLGKIFDPFFTTKLEKKGTGLGLSVVYSIVVKHHGTIHVQSQVSAGTTFTLRLPRAAV